MNAFIIYERLYDLNGEKRLVGGIESYLLTLAQFLQKKNIQPYIIQKANHDFKINQNNIIIYGFETKRSANLYKQLYKKIKKNIGQKDIIIWGLDRGAYRCKHKRTIAIQHGIPFDYYQEERHLHTLIKRLHLAHVLKLIQRLQAIIAFEKATYKVCVDYNFWNWYRTFSIPEEEKNIYIIPNFTKTCATRKFEEKTDILKIVFARRFVRMRGIEVFIKVVEHFANDNRFNFTFAGEGPYFKEIQLLSKKTNNVHITKYDPEDAVKFHEQFDIAVVPSLASEGTSLSLLEAMSAGNAPICTYVGGMTNIVIDGYNGIFVRPGSSEEIITAINHLAANPELRIKISKNAQETAQIAFSITAWENKWGKIIDKISQL